MSKQPVPERVLVSGPLARFADGFRVDLIERGYSLWRAQEQLYLLAHVSRWMEAEGLELAELTPATVERYFVWRRRVGYRKSLSPLSLRRLLGYLDALGVLPADDAVPTPVDGLLVEFRSYLLLERGVAAKTVELYEPAARLFLSGRSEPLAEDLARLSGADVNTFVLREARRRSARSAEMMVSALRALLRFLHVRGVIAEPLAAAVPSVACRREDLPRGIAARERGVSGVRRAIPALQGRLANSVAALPGVAAAKQPGACVGDAADHCEISWLLVQRRTGHLHDPVDAARVDSEPTRRWRSARRYAHDLERCSG